MILPTGADLIAQRLYSHGVRHIFGMPGSHSTYLHDAIHRHGDIATILCRNEQAGAFMADGYSRACGRVGVVCTTAGPGATNTLTGVAESYSDSIPVLLIAGHVNHDRIHEECGRYHEMNLERIFGACTRFSATVMNTDQIPGLVDQAMCAMVRGRPRPAALFLPQDLMAMVAPPAGSHTEVELCRSAPSDIAIQQASEILQASERPVIVAGGGAVWSDAGKQIEELSRRLECPVVTTLNGKGIVDERAANSLGHGRTRRARLAISRADLMLAVGCRFTEVFTASGAMPIPKSLVQIDVDPSQIAVNYPVTLGLVGDARTTLQAILSGLERRTRAWKDSWQRLRTAAQLKPEWFINTIRQQIPEDAVVFCDASEMALRMHTDFPAYSQRTFFYPSNYASLGWGFPAAVGGAVARPDRWIVCIAGDGGFLMTAQELATAVRYKLKIITVLHNDSAYGAIKAIQRAKHEGRYCDTDLNNPDFVRFAESFGVPASRAMDAAELETAIVDALRRDGPSLIEVPDQWRRLRVA